MANRVSASDSSVYEVVTETTQTYTLDDVDSEIATLEANITTYQNRLDYLRSLRSEMETAFAAVAEVSEASI